MILVDILLSITIGLLGIMIRNQIKLTKDIARNKQEIKDLKEFVKFEIELHNKKEG